MRHDIAYLRNSRVQYTDSLPGTLDELFQIGKSAVDDGIADQIEILEESGAVVRRYPRTLSTSSP